MQSVLLVLAVVLQGSLAMNPCKDTSKLTPSVDPNMGGQTCQGMADSMPTFSPDYSNCAANINYGGSTRSRFEAVFLLANKCCTSTASVCADYYTKVCKNMGNFSYLADAGVGGAICGAMVTPPQGLVAFDATVQACADAVPFGSNSMARTSILNAISPTCCQNTPHVCTAPFATTTTTVSHASVPTSAPFGQGLYTKVSGSFELVLSKSVADLKKDVKAYKKVKAAVRGAIADAIEGVIKDWVLIKDITQKKNSTGVRRLREETSVARRLAGGKVVVDYEIIIPETATIEVITAASINPDVLKKLINTRVKAAGVSGVEVSGKITVNAPTAVAVGTPVAQTGGARRHAPLAAFVGSIVLAMVGMLN